jgi:hypothetical protein
MKVPVLLYILEKWLLCFGSLMGLTTTWPLNTTISQKSKTKGQSAIRSSPLATKLAQNIQPINVELPCQCRVDCHTEICLLTKHSSLHSVNDLHFRVVLKLESIQAHCQFGIVRAQLKAWRCRLITVHQRWWGCCVFEAWSWVHQLCSRLWPSWIQLIFTNLKWQNEGWSTVSTQV